MESGFDSSAHFRRASVSPDALYSGESREQLLVRLQALQSVTETMLAHLTLPELLDTLLERLRSILQVDSATVLLCTPARDRLVVRASQGLEEEVEQQVEIPMGQGIAGSVAVRREAVIVDDVAAIDVVSPLLRRLASMMVAPLLVQGDLLGILHVGTRQRRTFSDSHLHLLQVVGDRMALAISNALLFEEVQRSRHELDRQLTLTRTITDNATSALLMMDPEGRCSFMNPAWERMSGFTFEECRRNTLHSLVHHTHPDGTPYPIEECPIDRALPEDFVVERHEDVFVRKDGTFFPVAAAARPILERGRSVGTVVEVRDISQEKAAEQQLRESEERYRLLVEQSPDMIAVHQDGQLVYLNPAGALLLGATRPDEVVGRSIAELVHPDSRDLVGHGSSRAGGAAGATGPADATFVRLDGQPVEVEVVSVPIPYHGRTAVQLVARSIAERKRTESALRLLSDASRSLVASLDYEETLRSVARLAVPVLADWCVVRLVDDAGRVRRLVAAAASPEREELLDRLHALYPPDYDWRDHPVGEVLQTGEGKLTGEITDELLRTISRGSEQLELMRTLGYRSAMVVPLATREQVLGTLSFVRGPTSRPYSEDDLVLASELARRAALAVEHARMYRQSEEANRAKADFLATMSHELRTPLNAMIGYAELLEMGIPAPLPSGSQEQVERIRLSARHLLSLIEEILTFSRLDAGREEVQLEPVRMEEVLREVEVITEPLARQHGLSFRVVAPPEPLVFQTDPRKLRQILLNFLGNAVKFTERGEVELSVQRADDAVRFHVRDTGIGIPEESRQKMFRPFWQVDQSNRRVAGGTGLGLAVSQRLARLLGGEISVQSTPGQGSTFTLALPLRPHEPAGS